MASGPVSALPRCFAMMLPTSSKDSTSYLHTLHADAEDENTTKFGELKENDDGLILTNPQARFFIEPSKKVEGYLHVRCGYNNKYWVPQVPPPKSGLAPTLAPRGQLVVGTTPERQEDKYNELCTLLKADLSRHDQDAAGNDIYLARFYDTHGRTVCIYTTNRSTEKVEIYDGFLLRDLSDHVVLPRHVAFKGDNGKYLSARYVNDHSYCQFISEEITDPSVTFIIFHNNDGTIRIKSKLFDRFLRLSPSWIWPDGLDSNPDDKDTFFKVTQVDDYYLLKSMGNQLFCKRLTADCKSDCLNAGSGHVTSEAKLWVEEAVLSREIYNVVYHGLDKARVYDSKTVDLSSSSAINATTKDNNVKLTQSGKETHSKEWDTSVSAKFCYKSTISAGVPGAAGAGTEWGVEVEGGFSFGKAEVAETKQEVVYEVVVPAGKKVTLSAIASMAKVDVPYSYTQRDMMPSGEVIISTHHDGMYRGKNTYNIQYVTREEDLPAKY